MKIIEIFSSDLCLCALHLQSDLMHGKSDAFSMLLYASFRSLTFENIVLLMFKINNNLQFERICRILEYNVFHANLGTTKKCQTGSNDCLLHGNFEAFLIRSAIKCFLSRLDFLISSRPRFLFTEIWRFCVERSTFIFCSNFELYSRFMKH